MQAGGVQDLNLVIKGDVQGSVEAIVGELAKIDHSEVRVNVIHTGVGGITENDVNLAVASNAMVVGFNVRPSSEARQLAERQGIDIRQYRVIYELTQQIQQALVGMLSPVETRGRDRRGRDPGALQGLAARHDRRLHGHERRRPPRVERPPLPRRNAGIHETTVAQLKRFKDDAREVVEGFECGILLEGFNDLREGDILEVYETREVERTSLDDASRRPRPQPTRRPSSRVPSDARLRRDPVGRAPLSRRRAR